MRVRKLALTNVLVYYEYMVVRAVTIAIIFRSKSSTREKNSFINI